jgi:hypothetical protein
VLRTGHVTTALETVGKPFADDAHAGDGTDRRDDEAD